jgi:hypothetical protein
MAVGLLAGFRFYQLPERATSRIPVHGVILAAGSTAGVVMSRGRGISMFRLISLLIALATYAVLLPISDVSAHCFVGGRFFPATLVIDDPCVADELSLPTVSVFKNGDEPSAREVDISGEFSKRITENFGISIAETWTHLRPPGGPNASGFQNLETTFKYQFLRDAQRELGMSAGVEVEWGRTGAAQVAAERFSTITPTLFFGKGFGDLPDTVKWIRPVALTGQIGYSIPSSATTTEIEPDTGEVSVARHPQFLVYGVSLQYSMPYLKSSVVDLGLPDFINHLIPIVEARFETPVANNFGQSWVTTGTVNPGVIWVGSYFQVGVEAIIPINRESGTGGRRDRPAASLSR